MKKVGVIYIGSFLSEVGFTPQPIESIKFLFEKEYNFFYASKKKNLFFRYIDMLFVFLKYRKKADVVIIDVYSGLAYYYALTMAILSRTFGINYFLVIHGGNFESRIVGNKKLTSFLLNSAAKVVAPSSFMAEVLNKHGFTAEIIANPLNLSLYNFKKRTVIRPEILWVRSFHKFYNPELAVEIIRLLHAKGIAANLCMVGPEKDDSYEYVLKKTQEYSLSDYIRFTGKLDKSEWLKLSESYDIFINTTNFDNMPISVIEAMTQGLLVVSTNVGGLPYLIKDGENGFLVNPNSAELFVEKILYCLNEKNAAEMKSMMSNAYNHTKQFDIESVFGSWKKAIQNVVQ